MNLLMVALVVVPLWILALGVVSLAARDRSLLIGPFLAAAGQS